MASSGWPSPRTCSRTRVNNTQLQAMRDTFGQLGVEVVGVTDAQMKVETRSPTSSLMALKPDAILSTPIDPVSTEAGYRAAVKGGAKIVFIENIAANFVPGKDYVSAIAADNLRQRRWLQRTSWLRRSAARVKSASSSMRTSS